MSLVILLLIGYFVLALIVQSIMSKSFCAMCVSVTFSWLTLLVLDFKHIYTDPLIIGILMGGSAVGLVYYLFRHKSNLEIFKFPLLSSLFWLVYILLQKSSVLWVRDVTILGGLWVFFLFIYMFYQNGKIKDWGKRIIECCKNW